MYGTYLLGKFSDFREKLSLIFLAKFSSVAGRIYLFVSPWAREREREKEGKVETETETERDTKIIWTAKLKLWYNLKKHKTCTDSSTVGFPNIAKPAFSSSSEIKSQT